MGLQAVSGIILWPRQRERAREGAREPERERERVRPVACAAAELCRGH